MFRVYLIVILVLPLIGLGVIESEGYFGGYPNGSILPYIFFLFVFYLSYKIIGKTEVNTVGKEQLDHFLNNNFKFNNKIKVRVFWVLFFFLCLSLFAFNGINVLLGNFSKGQFRSQMGYFGFVMAIPTKFIFPAVFTRFCFIYYENKVRRFGKYNLDWSFLIMCLLALMYGLTFGDKSMAITNLLCGLIAMFWGITKIKHLVLFGSITIPLLIITGMMFDQFLKNQSLEHVIDYLIYRSFALSAESSWRVWDLYITQNIDFNYWYTLIGVFGSGVIYLIFGVGKFDAEAYMFNFGKAVTVLFYPEMAHLVNDGSWNITPSAYAEGILIGGWIGIFIIALIGGRVFKFIQNKITKSVNIGNYSLASVYIVYFVYVYSTWIITGGITTLIHPISIGGSIIAYKTLRFLERLIIK